MAKNKIDSDTIERIQNLSYLELGKAVTAGEFTTKMLRQAYSQMRSVAVKRYERISSEKNVKQFGEPSLHFNNGEYFRKTKYIVGQAELLKEIKDVSRFLKSKTSTVAGLREKRANTLNQMSERGFEISNENYLKFIEFMKWFKASEFSKQLDSDHPVVAEIFNSERATPEDWRRAFEAYAEHNKPTPAPYRQY